MRHPVLVGLEDKQLRLETGNRDPMGELVAGWGRRPSGDRAMALAKVRGKQPILLEDGFLRSYCRHDAPISLVVDDVGIFYDSNGPSRLDHLISKPLSDNGSSRAHALRQLWMANKVSKYNSGRLIEPAVEPHSYVLVVDQIRGDLSVQRGMANSESFARMLDAALIENANSTIVVKTHPDSKANFRKGYLNSRELSAHPRIKVVAGEYHPVPMIERADAVYTVTSQVGFEALIWGKSVRTFGMPFYAGWGLTKDELSAPRWRGDASIEQLVHAALVEYCRYVDPANGQQCEIERAIEHIALQRQKRAELPERITVVGSSRWRRSFVGNFLQGSELTFTRRIDTALANGERDIVVWGSKHLPKLNGKCRVLQLEDGFLRSYGLGAELIPPLSLVVDDIGIYYDANRPSRLEKILNEQELNNEQIARVTQLRQKIISRELTKYNTGTGKWRRPSSTRRVVLVVGQVESDASIEYGSPIVKSNMHLLAKVREETQDAYILYKPHPDVVAGLRPQGQNEEGVDTHCDEIIGDVPGDTLFSQIDELHTMTSLMGFEALLRGVPVVCHGLPFYAGWGLTIDKLDCERRSRKLSLDELAFGTLITYPRYCHHKNKIFIEPETAVDLLTEMIGRNVRSQRWHQRMLQLALIGWVWSNGSIRCCLKNKRKL